MDTQGHTTVTWHCRKHFNQWQQGFHLKAALPLAKRLVTVSDCCNNNKPQDCHPDCQNTLLVTSQVSWIMLTYNFETESHQGHNFETESHQGQNFETESHQGHNESHQGHDFETEQGTQGPGGKGPRAPENPMGPLCNFTRGPNGPPKIGELVMYFNGGTLQILLGALGNSNGGGLGPSTEIVYREPCRVSSRSRFGDKSIIKLQLTFLIILHIAIGRILLWNVHYCIYMYTVIGYTYYKTKWVSLVKAEIYNNLEYIWVTLFITQSNRTNCITVWHNKDICIQIGTSGQPLI